MTYAKIRGTYSTALTKLLIDSGFAIVQPSATVRERFGLNENDEFPDLEVAPRDHQDRQGVLASGTTEAVKAFTSLLQSCLDDVVIRKRGGSAEFPEGSCLVNVEFPSLSKKKLDKIRGSVTSTVDGHHYYQACGADIPSALNMAEKLLEEGGPREEVEALLRDSIKSRFPVTGSWIEIEHVKLDGKLVSLGKAVIESLDRIESMIRFRRVFKKKGTYDGLEIRKDPGDYAVTEAKIGEWYFKTKYFSSGGLYKGMYVNLNTPIELYPHTIRYVDLELDVCVWPNGRVRRLDEEKLKDAADEGIITSRLVGIIREKLQEIVKDLN